MFFLPKGNHLDMWVEIGYEKNELNANYHRPRDCHQCSPDEVRFALLLMQSCMKK